jgi:hypothetical protein
VVGELRKIRWGQKKMCSVLFKIMEIVHVVEHFVSEERSAMVSEFLTTRAWHFLRLQMKKVASRCGG